MVQTLDVEQLELVFCEIGIGLANKIPAAYAVTPLSSLTAVGKDRWVVTASRVPLLCCHRYCPLNDRGCFVSRVAADVKHLLMTLRRCHGLRKASPEDSVDVDTTAPVRQPSLEHVAILSSGQSALDSLEAWVNRHFYGVASQTSPAPSPPLHSSVLPKSASPDPDDFGLPLARPHGEH
jgi:hypothetical protein